MNKADYQMVSTICFVLGGVLSVGGILADIILNQVYTKMNASEFFWSYAYSSLIVGGGIILVVIGWGFHWRARQEK